MKERYQLRQAAGAYWLLDMEQGEQYKKPFMLNECGAYIYRAYISGMSEDEIMQAFDKRIWIVILLRTKRRRAVYDGVKTTGNYLRMEQV